MAEISSSYKSDNSTRNTPASKCIVELMEASGLDEQTCEILLNEFSKQALKTIEDAKAHLSKEQYTEVEILLHRMKGSAANMRAYEISLLAKEAGESLKAMNLDKLDILLCDIKRLVDELFITKQTEEHGNDK
jgi:HPt (histidine-containing phosphotransfer) domain-containing protein